MKKLFQIAIDGPVGAGKGTAAKIVASRLGILYVDTGAMYRVAAWLAKKNGVALADAKKIAGLTQKAKITLRLPTDKEEDGRLMTVLVDGEDVSWEIRTDEVTQAVPIVAKHREVRRVLVEKQQAIAKERAVVMEGRDIALRVLPDAQLKIYLTADLETRARRRHKDLLSQGMEVDLETVKKKIQVRDKRDMEREVDPLQVVPGAWVLDTTKLSIIETVDLIEEKVKELGYGKK